jgi:DNA-binding response OmpR family regulator
MNTLLLVEDDLNLGALIKDALEDEGYSVILVNNGKTALNTIQNSKANLAILDVMLPDIDGFTLGKLWKETYPNKPILFLTAKGQTEDKIKGLTIGDEYVTKPFETQELLLRIKNLLERKQNNQNTIQTFTLGKYTFSPQQFTLEFPDKQVKKLTARESALLEILCHNRGAVIKRSNLLMAVWGKDDYFTGRSMDVFISRLRKYLALDDSIKIQVVHGVGFRLD